MSNRIEKEAKIISRAIIDILMMSKPHKNMKQEKPLDLKWNLPFLHQ